MTGLNFAVGATLSATDMIAYFVSNLSSTIVLIPYALGVLILTAVFISRMSRVQRHALHAALAVSVFGIASTLMNVMRLGDVFADSAERYDRQYYHLRCARPVLRLRNQFVHTSRRYRATTQCQVRTPAYPASNLKWPLTCPASNPIHRGRIPLVEAPAPDIGRGSVLRHLHSQGDRGVHSDVDAHGSR